MIVKVLEDREICTTGTSGTQNENDVTELKITVPEQYENYRKVIYFYANDKIIGKDMITDNTYKLTKTITQYERVYFFIKFIKGTEEWISKTHKLDFYLNTEFDDDIGEKELDLVNSIVNILEEEIINVKNLEKDVENLIKGLEDFSVTLQYPTFEINNNMKLVVNTAENMNNLDFAINENGELEVQL